VHPAAIGRADIVRRLAALDTEGHDAKRGPRQRSAGRVLIADDVPELLTLLRAFLTWQGYEVATAMTGAEALEAVPTFRPDVVLVDMQMPGLSGMNVLEALRQAGLTLPVVVISAQPPQDGEGFFAALEKPFGLASVAETVAAAMDHARRVRLLA
jgi:CheY-like chemotaxis protein